MKKLTKEQKQEISKILNFYSGAGKYGWTNVLFFGVFIATDVMTTFGMGLLLGSSAGIASFGAEHFFQSKINVQWMNGAGQVIRSSRDVKEALFKIENNFRYAFLSLERSKPEEMTYALDRCREYEEEIKSLMPVFNIVSGGARYKVWVGGRMDDNGDVHPVFVSDEIERIKIKTLAAMTPPPVPALLKLVRGRR